jgi:hypothetical protein
LARGQQEAVVDGGQLVEEEVVCEELMPDSMVVDTGSKEVLHKEGMTMDRILSLDNDEER